MLQLNTPQNIGNKFYAQPPNSASARAEYVFNTLYGTIPTTLSFSEEFDKNCLQTIQESFDPLCAHLSKVGDSLVDEGLWVGKADTFYEGSILSVAYRSADGNSVLYDAGVFIVSGVGSATPEPLSEDNLHVAVRFACKDKEQAKNMVELLAPFKLKEKSNIYILASEYGDLSFNALPVETSKTDLALNYGDEFLETHKELIDSLNNTRSGLYLFHGLPGTGKSSYIRHLLSENIHRKIAYIPVSLIDRLTHPDMLPLLMRNKNIILVLEDAEKALLSRDITHDSAIVPTILNLTDGLIGDAINLSIVATFNTEKDNIDSALLRKGRLRMSHEFKKLSKENCKKIASSRGIDPDQITEDMTLAEIYNHAHDAGFKVPEERRVGFF